MTKIYFDTEFTGLHKNTTLISIGIVSDCGKSFYAELTDYNKDQIDDWLKNNVINNLLMNNLPSEGVVLDSQALSEYRLKGNIGQVKEHLTIWLSQFDKVEMYSDCLSYDWVLFCDIFGHAFSVPKNVYYMPFDLVTSFKENGIDPDINREKFLDSQVVNEICSILKVTPENGKHNALWDAYVIRECFNKIERI